MVQSLTTCCIRAPGAALVSVYQRRFDCPGPPLHPSCLPRRLLSRNNLYLPTPQAQTIAVTTVATAAAIAAKGGIASPNIVTEVRVANKPPAGVKPPYIHAWKAAAKEPRKIQQDPARLKISEAGEAEEIVRALKSFRDIPATIPAGPKPMHMRREITTVKVIHHAIISASTSRSLSLVMSAMWPFGALQGIQGCLSHSKTPFALSANFHASDLSAANPLKPAAKLGA